MFGQGQAIGPVNDPQFGSIQMRQPTINERLIEKRDKLKQELQDVEQAISSMEKCPEVTAALEAINKVQHF